MAPENFPTWFFFILINLYFIIFLRLFFSALGKVICTSARHTGRSAKWNFAFQSYFILYRLLKTNVVNCKLNKFWENGQVENSYVRMRIKLNPVFEYLKRVVSADKWTPYQPLSLVFTHHVSKPFGIIQISFWE